MNSTKGRGEVGELLRRARRQIARWRAKCGGRGRMPNRLWELAAEAAADCGVDAAAAELGLSVQRLKARMGAREKSATDNVVEAAQRTAAFQELSWPWAGTSECLLELESPSGQRLRIRLAGEAVAQAESLARTLGSACS